MVVAAFTAPFIAISMLNCCGFGALGIAAGESYFYLQLSYPHNILFLSKVVNTDPSSSPTGSIAAWIHSLTGAVTACSPFAILQSAGMGGYGVAIIKFVASIVGCCYGSSDDFIEY